MQKLDAHDVAFLVFLAAAIFSNERASARQPEHVPIVKALVGAFLANLGSIALWPNRGFVPIVFALLVPAMACWAIGSVHGFVAWRIWPFFVLMCAVVFGVSLLVPQAYTWSILVAWSMISGLAWLMLLDPERKPSGLTYAASIILCASMLADIPGLWAWASSGSWQAESILSVLAVVMLAMVPPLWTRVTSER